MSLFFYNIFLFLFRAFIHVAAIFNDKARKWVNGRQAIFKKLEEAIPAGEKIIWIHCASLGEFEQGRPVMEKLKLEYPTYKLLLTFFSPSGFEVQKNYSGADWVFYLPLDGPATAKRFLDITHPSLVIFVKYEFWFYYLKKIKYRNIPLLLVSALFRKDMSFFKWHGAIQRKMLTRFDQLFLQNESSKSLLTAIGLAQNCTVAGDTRFDRVVEIAAKAERIPTIEKFIGNNKVIIAGSTWPEDESVLRNALNTLTDKSIKLIIAPHEISESHLSALTTQFPDALLFSSLTEQPAAESSVLLIDNYGMLSRLYQYGWITYVGGGFRNMGVHNVLEAAVFNKIVLFGPSYHKYVEAVDLVMSGGGIPVEEEKLAMRINNLLDNEEEFATRSKAAGDFVHTQQGATNKIMQFIQENRLLTN